MNPNPQRHNRKAPKGFFLLWLTLAALLFALSCPAEQFNVAALNDLHVTDEPRLRLLNKAIDQINTDGVQLTVVLGDLTAEGTPSEMNLARQALDHLKAPFVVIPGNHDSPTNRPFVFSSTFGPRHWVRQEGRWCLIGIDTCVGTASSVSVQPSEMAWIREQVAKVAKDTPIALCAHHPFNPHSKSYRVKNAAEVLALFSGHKLKLVAAGHFHGNQEETRDGVLFVTTACCSTTRNNHDKTTQKGFRLFTFEGDSVQSRFVAVALE